MTHLYRYTVDGRTVEAYYDRHERAWCAYTVDPETGYQRGPAAYDPDRESAVRAAVIDDGSDHVNPFYGGPVR